ncbi:hypothetical protein I4U23_023807 [Adineta vaga]|nr:hypothetical protein I4U23_023807 [Adineta vaga]
MKKRILTTLSEEMEPIVKRPRLLDALLLSPTVDDEIENDELSSFPLNSLNEPDDDDIIELLTFPFQQMDNTIVLNSDDDDDDEQTEENVDITIGSPPSLSDLFNAFISSPSMDNPIETVEVDEEIDTDEIIDLTEDEIISNSCLSNEFEQNQSTNKNDDDDEQCPVCLETFYELQCTGVDLIITQCQHVMCISCSRRVLAYSSRCPLCRENVNINTLTPYCILA